jgi:hypothetical protein
VRDLESDWIDLDKAERGAGCSASKAELTPMLSTAAKATKADLILFTVLGPKKIAPEKKMAPDNALQWQ